MLGLSREVGSFRQAPDNYENGGSAAAEKDLFAFGLFKVPYESVLVFPEIFRRPLNLTVARSFVHLADHKAQHIFFQRFSSFSLERLQVAHGRRLFYTATPGYAGEIGLSCGRAGLADPRSAVNLIIKDKNGQVRGIQIPQSGKIIEREQKTAVGFERDHFSVR